MHAAMPEWARARDAAKRQSRKNERKKASRKRKVQRFKGKNGRSAANGARTHALQVHQEARGSTF